MSKSGAFVCGGVQFVLLLRLAMLMRVHPVLPRTWIAA